MRRIAVIILVALAETKSASGAELKADAINAWDQYVRTTQSRTDERTNGAKPFLWVQESDERVRLLRSGGIAIAPATGNGRTPVPGALIHDWIGAVFVRGVNAGEVLAKLDRYDDYRKFYKPTVVESKLLGRDGNSARFSMTWQKKTALVNNTISADYGTLYCRPAPDRWWSVARSTRVQEIEHYGLADARLKPAGVGKGYIWRVYSVIRVMELNGGAVVELEALVLSRDIPLSVAWLVNPIIDRLSRNVLVTTLSKTREAIAR